MAGSRVDRARNSQGSSLKYLELIDAKEFQLWYFLAKFLSPTDIYSHFMKSISLLRQLKNSLKLSDLQIITKIPPTVPKSPVFHGNLSMKRFFERGGQKEKSSYNTHICWRENQNQVEITGSDISAIFTNSLYTSYL